MLRFLMASASGWAMRGRKLRTNRLKFSLSRRWDSAAMVSNTSEDLPDPDTPVKMVIWRLGIFTLMSLRLFSRAPRISINSCIICGLYLVAARHATRRGVPTHRPGGEDGELPF